MIASLGSLLLGILAPRPQRLPRWSDGTAAMAGRVVAEGWRCRAGQPQAACIRKLLRRLRGGRLRPFANRTNVSATSCAPASACAAARARALGRRVDVVAFGGSVTVGHGTGGRSGNRESKFMPYVELFAAALRVTSGSEVRAFNFGVPAAGPHGISYFVFYDAQGDNEAAPDAWERFEAPLFEGWGKEGGWRFEPADNDADEPEEPVDDAFDFEEPRDESEDQDGALDVSPLEQDDDDDDIFDDP